MVYSRENPYIAPIIDKRSLTCGDSKKDTRHIAVDISHSGMTYEVGDCLGIYPENDLDLVEKTLDASHFTGAETILDKRRGEFIPLREFLTKYASLTQFSRKFLIEVLGQEPEEPKTFQVEFEVWDLLKAHPKSFDAQTFSDRLMPLLPRLYSIASSPMQYPNEVHLTVAHLRYETRGQERKGVCTDFLCERAKELLVYIHPHKGFTLPKDPSVPIIMVGPGTGVAPYRGFMQERALQKTDKNWLFFGEWTKECEYFYREEWEKWNLSGLLKLDLAFSRDQGYKIYVQHRMLEKSKELFSWLNQGAIFYVCGDAKRMAKDVDKALHEIIEIESSQNASEYVKNLKKEGRYLRDVY